MGLELELAYASDISKPMGVNFNLNFTYLKDEIKSVPEGIDYIPGAAFGVGGNIATRFEVGYQLDISLVMRQMVFSKIKSKLIIKLTNGRSRRLNFCRSKW